MKKSIKKIFSALALIAGLSMVFTGCAYPNARLTGQDTGYAVTSQGGSAVQYGDYVYFLNGANPFFSDPDGRNNRWGDVALGGIYRVKLQGGAAVKKTDAGNVEYKTYERETGGALGFKTREAMNFLEDEERITMIDESSVERVVPKFVTLKGRTAGIFIYDGWIYYPSPNYRKNKTGSVDIGLTDFFRTKVDGSGTQRLYSSANAVEDYNFYNYNGKVYLVLAESIGEEPAAPADGSLPQEEENKNIVLELVSVEIGKKPGRTVRLEQDIRNVYFPRKDVYYKGIDEDTASDYVYYTRSIPRREEYAVAGNIFEARRPDLRADTGIQISNNNGNYQPSRVQGNTLFYYETNILSGSRNTELWAQPDFSPVNIFKDEGNKTEDGGWLKREGTRRDRVSVLLYNHEVMQHIVPFNTGAMYYAVVTGDNGIGLFYEGKDSWGETLDGSEGSKIIKTDADGTVYYIQGSSGRIASKHVSDLRPESITYHSDKEVFNDYSFLPDIAADMVWYFGAGISQAEFDFELGGEGHEYHEGHEDEEAAIIPSNYMRVRHLSAQNKEEKHFIFDCFIGEVDERHLPEED